LLTLVAQESVSENVPGQSSSYANQDEKRNVTLDGNATVSSIDTSALLRKITQLEDETEELRRTLRGAHLDLTKYRCALGKSKLTSDSRGSFSTRKSSRQSVAKDLEEVHEDQPLHMAPPAAIAEAEFAVLMAEEARANRTARAEMLEESRALKADLERERAANRVILAELNGWRVLAGGERLYLYQPQEERSNSSQGHVTDLDDETPAQVDDVDETIEAPESCGEEVDPSLGLANERTTAVGTSTVCIESPVRGPDQERLSVAERAAAAAVAAQAALQSPPSLQQMRTRSSTLSSDGSPIASSSFGWLSLFGRAPKSSKGPRAPVSAVVEAAGSRSVAQLFEV